METNLFSVDQSFVVFFHAFSIILASYICENRRHENTPSICILKVGAVLAILDLEVKVPQGVQRS